MIGIRQPAASASINPAVGLAIGAMVSVQISVALSRPVMEEIGAPAFAWLRMMAAAAILIVLVRPVWRHRTTGALFAALMLGAALACMSASLFAAAARLPLGLAVTIAFLGPLSVSVISARGQRPLALGLALIAGVGAILVISPATGTGRGWAVDPLGLGFALLSAVGWALYIVLTRRVGRLFSQSDGLCLSLLAAAVVLTPAGLGQLEKMPDLSLLLAAAGLAVLAPLLPCWLEMVALRRLGTQTFGILMSLEPAIAMLLGLLILNEIPGPLQVVGMVYVILASAAAVALLERPGAG